MSANTWNSYVFGKFQTSLKGNYKGAAGGNEVRTLLQGAEHAAPARDLRTVTGKYPATYRPPLAAE